MTGLALAARSARRYKARTALAVTGVAVIAALNFDMLMLSRGLLLSFADMINSAGFDVRIVGSSGLPALRLAVTDVRKLAGEVGRLPEVEDVAILQVEPGSASSLSASAGAGEQRVTIIGTSAPAARGGWNVVRGRDPGAAAGTGPPEVVISRRLADLLALEPSAMLQVRAGVRGERSILPALVCRVVAVADFTFEATDEFTVATTLEGLRAVRGGADLDEADIVLVASRPDAGADRAVAAIARLRPDLQVFSNQTVIEQFNRNGFAYFRQLSAILSGTTMLFTFLLVSTLLTVSVNQRLGEIAALRAIGISRRRVAGMLLWESGLLVGAGGVLALPLGGALAVALDGLLRRMPGLPQQLHFFMFEPRTVVLQIAVLAITAAVAAVYPVRLAVSLPIAATLRRELVS